VDDKHQRFVEEYLVDLNATQAAIRAGYSPKSAECQGSRLLRNVKVAAAIREAKAARPKYHILLVFLRFWQLAPGFAFIL
jgi:phage terminase small subunit